MTMDDFAEQMKTVLTEQNTVITNDNGDVYIDVEDAIIAAWLAFGRLNVKRNAETLG